MGFIQDPQNPERGETQMTGKLSTSEPLLVSITGPIRTFFKTREDD